MRVSGGSFSRNNTKRNNDQENINVDDDDVFYLNSNKKNKSLPKCFLYVYICAL
jgi:hypothetical protein